MNPAILFLSSVLMTGAPSDIVPVGCDGGGCGSAVALPAACSGCGPTCASGICGKGDPNPLEKTGLLASLKKRLTPAPRNSDGGCCGASSGRMGLFQGGIFQGGLLGKLRDGNASAPTGCNGAGCGNSGCSEPAIVIGHTPVSSCALPAAPVIMPPSAAPQAMPTLPAAPVGESRTEKAPTPMPTTNPAPAPEKKTDAPKAGSVSLPSIPSVPVSPASGPAASNNKPRF